MNKLINLKYFKASINQFPANSKIILRMASSTSKYLISEPKYSFLKQLGLSEINDGVFCGHWFGDGTIIESLSPANNKPIAQIKQVNIYLFQ